jgi:PAS domain S-box-containing protein
MKNKDNPEQTNNLNHKLNDAPKNISTEAELKTVANETLELIHQLEVHQVELEMMNEELKRAQNTAQKTAEKYTELFDFAPSGYFSLTSEGVISEINLYASDMLGKERFYLINRRFAFFIANDSKPIFNNFLNNVFEKKTKQYCEITLTNNYNVLQYVQLAGKISQDDEKCLVTMVDITELKKLSEINETLLTSLPYPAMYIKFPDRVIVAANKQALKMGAKVGGQCWREFGKSEYISQQYKKIAAKYPDIVPAEYDIKCSFCLAENCFMEFSEQRNSEIHAFGLIWDVYWLKVSKDIFLHYAVDVTELIKAEEALKESELKLRTVVDYTVDWVFWVDVNDIFLYCSTSCEKITGYKSSDFIDNHKLLVEIIYPDDLEIFQHHKQMEETNRQTNLEIQFRIIRKDGSIRWIGHLCKSVFNEAGDFAGIRGSNRDITERKEMELQLVNSEQKYKHLSENISDGVFMCKNGILKYTNQSMNTIFGYDYTEMDGMKITELAMPEFKDELNKIINLNATINQTRKIDLNCIKKDTSVLNMEMLLQRMAQES